MTYFRSLLLFGVATCLPGQTPPPKPNVPPPMPQVKLEVENPGVKQPEVPPDRVIIAVGDVKITAAQFDKLIDTLQPQYRTLARGAGRRQFADNLAKMLTLAQEAQRRKMNETSDYKTRAMFQDDNILAAMLVEEMGKDIKVSEADVRQYYADHKSEYEQVRAHHILIRVQGSQVPVRPGQKDLTDAEALAKAQEIRKKIQDGADFGEMAKLESDDIGSGSNGGYMPAFRHGQMVPSFEQAAFAMKPGELSEPVKSQFGYHIILVVSHESKSFEDMKTELENRIKPEQTQKAIDKAIEDLQKRNPALLDPEFFGPTPKAPEGTVSEEVEKIRSGRHAPMPLAQRDAGASVASGRTTMSIKNSTAYDLSVFFDGPMSTKLTLLPGATQELDLAPGAFHLAGRVAAADVLPFYGEETYAGSARYSMTFYISQ